MDDLIFSLNATLPIFLMMMLGYFLRRVGLVTQEFADLANGFVFKVALPVVLFDDLCRMDIVASWDGGFVAFCALATLASILLCWLVSRASSSRRPTAPARPSWAWRSSRASMARRACLRLWSLGPCPSTTCLPW